MAFKVGKYDLSLDEGSFFFPGRFSFLDKFSNHADVKCPTYCSRDSPELVIETQWFLSERQSSLAMFKHLTIFHFQ